MRLQFSILGAVNELKISSSVVWRDSSGEWRHEHSMGKTSILN